ncbi:hypothetical protein THAOC_02603 [Thalassiosira oceanica]|uniref:Chloride channel protein n=1 Tax=Thalassiosira oceanica TaxID=159749 RepID=K0TAE6_THAOC|nr:hypothetical protein THAOC_02603 [Thalassiosira oceanica]|eukprot:EJK75668.1 hypothetical protein THAOC_02603 [Thalassiosira oceanica]
MIAATLLLFCLQLSPVRGFRSGVVREESSANAFSISIDRTARRLRHAVVLKAVKEDVSGSSRAVEVATSQNGESSTSKRPKPVYDPDTRRPSTSTGGLTDIPSRQLPNNWLGEKTYILFSAVLIGLCTGLNISLFKEAVEFVRSALYGDGSSLPESFRPILEMLPLSAIPVLGAIAVGVILRVGGEFPPGLRDTVKEVDLDSIRESGVEPPEELLSCTKLPPISERDDFVRFTQKALAATATLGTGNSLGPEGPSVEAGMSFSRLLTNNRAFSRLTNVFGQLDDGCASDTERVRRRVARDRLLLSVGAAAGVSAGFNAPLSGVFFALEIVQNSLVPFRLPLSDGDGGDEVTTIGGEPLAVEQISISAILLASVISALTIQALLGNELALRLGDFEFNNPLLELPLYLLLGALAGLTAAIFSGTAQYLKSIFDGDAGFPFVRDTFQNIPKYQKPLIGSLVTGWVGVYIPQVLFFGVMSKLLTTAISAASGLVGGTFAPSLFLGGVLGAIFHNICELLSSNSGIPEVASYQLSGLPAFAMIGSASVLAALFRAPLTARYVCLRFWLSLFPCHSIFLPPSLLLFETTRNYDVILPLMASAGVASLTGDIVEKWLDEEQRENG